MDWHEFYESEEFRSYRVKMAEEIGSYTYGMISHSGFKPEAGMILKGALDMAYKILSLPAKSTNDVKQQSIYQEQVQQDMAKIAEAIVQKRMQNGI